MFAPLILPLQWTCVVVLILMLVTQAATYIFSKNRWAALLLSCLAAVGFGIVAFIPTLIIVGYVVDAVRYRQFEFETASQITDGYVNITPSATKITMRKYTSGHIVRFHVDEHALRVWLDDVIEKHRKDDNFSLFESGNTDLFPDRDPAAWEQAFGRHGWKAPEDVVKWKGWLAGRGYGFTVWYAPSSQTAFLRASYW